MLALAAHGAVPQAAPRFEDSMAQRMQACTGCHGEQGRAAPDGYYPRIAGKPAGYLYRQLLDFRDGRRHHAPMAALLAPLSDDYLREIAGHFAGLDLPHAPPQPATAGAEVLARGRQLALQGDPALERPACADCHGEALTGTAPAIPGLLGLSRDYLVAQLGAWRSGRRKAQAPDCMARIADALTPAEIGALSQWLASQPVPADARPAPALPRPLPQPCGSAELSGAAR
jgi:cytochrome c553